MDHCKLGQQKACRTTSALFHAPICILKHCVSLLHSSAFKQNLNQLVHARMSCSSILLGEACKMGVKFYERRQFRSICCQLPIMVLG
jgi:hypothetical protein